MSKSKFSKEEFDKVERKDIMLADMAETKTIISSASSADESICCGR